jgi:hypothetical protein
MASPGAAQARGKKQIKAGGPRQCAYGESMTIAASESFSSRRAWSAFHDYVRGVFAEHSRRALALRARRASWLYRFSQGEKIRIRATNLYSRH